MNDRISERPKDRAEPPSEPTDHEEEVLDEQLAATWPASDSPSRWAANVNPLRHEITTPLVHRSTVARLEGPERDGGKLMARPELPWGPMEEWSR